MNSTKISSSFWKIAVLLIFALLTCKTQAAAGGGGGGGGGGGAGGDGRAIELPKISDDELQKFEQQMTVEQKQLFNEMLELNLKRQSSKTGKTDVDRAALRKEGLTILATLSPEERKSCWARMIKELPKARRKVDSLYSTDQEKKEANALPATAKKDVEMLLSDDIESFLAAWPKVLSYGPACRAIVADAARPVTNPIKQRRLKMLLNVFDCLQKIEQLIRKIELAFTRLAELQRMRGNKTQTNLQLLMSRNVVDNRESLATEDIKNLCYFSFPCNKHGYGNIPVSLEYGNGENTLQVRMYGGQENSIKDFGMVDFDSVKSTPKAEVAEEQWGERCPAVVGHVYVEHCLEEREHIDQWFKFKVIEIDAAHEWIIIEWAPIPQEK
ncbi:MAG: hypothetical protein V1899_08515 [Planctomycetota bacterium]